MNWLILSHLVGFGVVALLFGEGLSILVRARVMPYVRWLGLLTIFLAGLGGIGQALSFWGVFVFSPEFSLVMVQGNLARLGLSLIIFGLAVSFGVSWHLARAAAAWPSRWPWLLTGGIIVGLVSTFGIQPINPEETEPFFVVYAYNLWWPPLLIWFGVCLVEIYATLLRIKNRWACRWLTTLGVAGLSLLALRQPGLSDSLQVLWIACLLLVVPLNTILAAKKGFGWIWLVLPLPAALAFSQLKLRLRKFKPWLNLGWVIIATLMVSSLLGLLLALIFGLWLWLEGEWFAENRIFSVLFGVSAFGFWSGWLLLALGLADGPPLYQKQRAGILKESRLTLRQIVLLGSLTFLAFSLTGFFYLAAIDPSVALVIFFLAWTLLSEVAARGLFHQLWRLQREGKLFNKEGRVKFYRAGQRLSSGLGRLTQVNSIPVMIVKVLLGLAVLIILSEVTNAGKVTIQPFSAFGFRDEKYGEVMANRVFVNLGLLTQQLQPDIIVPSPGSPNPSSKQKSKFSYVMLTSSSVDAALAESPDLDLYGVKIPLNLLVTPLQQPVRSLLGVNIINGSIQQDRDKYMARAYSSQGMTWQVDYSIISTRLSEDKNFAQKVEQSADDALSNLAEELAFKIIRQEPALAALGMTDSWLAFDVFQEGIRNLNNSDFDDLTAAIQNFREATKRDPRFAIAYYRLGLALQDDGQPAAAAEAFRASLVANPEFAPGYNALAYLLYNFDSYANYYSSPAAVLPQSPADYTTRWSRDSEARRLWQSLILLPEAMATLPDRASAYYGLCLYTANYEEPTQLAYFYCQQAERLYQELPSALRSTPSIKQAEASVLTLLGIILSKTENIYFTFPGDTWVCYASYFDNQGQILPPRIYYSVYQPAALQYHQRALALQPDDTVIRCNAASSAYALGNPQLLEELANSPETHLILADDYSNSAKQVLRQDQELSSSYYRLAIDEYQQAINLDPNNVLALNNYAYNFWVWRYYMPQAEPPLGPDSEIANLAEQYARQAVNLVSNKYGSVNEEIVRSTLGEVLLGKGRPQEAIEVLRYVIDKKMLQQHPLYNEIRWDLAQAYLCAAYNARTDQRSSKEIEGLTDKAKRILDQIRQNEQGREYQFFTPQPELLDPLFTPLACRRENAAMVEPTPPSAGVAYVLLWEQPNYKVGMNCDRMGVTAQVYPWNDDRDDDHWLHVWGGGIDNYVEVSAGVRADIFLANQPRRTYDYYFAQLEDGEGNPISKVYSFETYGKDQEGCQKNLISLEFFRQR